MMTIAKIVILIGLGFVAGQTYRPAPAEAGVVDRVVEELHGIAEAVDRVGDRLVCPE
jgi:hypothetical protein